MNWKRAALGVVLAALWGATLACGGNVNVSTAKVADAYMSTDEDGANRATVYAQDATFYAQVDLQNAPDDTALKAVWTAVDAQGTETGLVINETETTTGSGLIHFTLSNNDLWPTGAYKVELYLNDELVNTLDFSVQ